MRFDQPPDDNRIRFNKPSGPFASAPDDDTRRLYQTNLEFLQKRMKTYDDIGALNEACGSAASIDRELLRFW